MRKAEMAGRAEKVISIPFPPFHVAKNVTEN